MSRSIRLPAIALVLAMVATMAIGVIALSTAVQAKGRCVCPKIYAPVECDRGKVYANQCLADCRNAKNCVPVGSL